RDRRRRPHPRAVPPPGVRGCVGDRRRARAPAKPAAPERADHAAPDVGRASPAHAGPLPRAGAGGLRTDAPRGRRGAAGEALREERFAAAAAAYGELVEADDGDPALRWAWGHSLAALGEARGEEEAARAIFMSMANGWVRRGVAEEMWLVDQREAALEQY